MKGCFNKTDPIRNSTVITRPYFIVEKYSEYLTVNYYSVKSTLICIFERFLVFLHPNSH